jgi:hypothetical protein
MSFVFRRWQKNEEMSRSIANITLLVTVNRSSFPLFVTNDHGLENTINDVMIHDLVLYI